MKGNLGYSEDGSRASGFECPRCHSRTLQQALQQREHDGSIIFTLRCLNVVGDEMCGEVWDDI